MINTYTDEEVQYIRDHYRQDGPIHVANHLGRTPAAIRTKARLLGITRNYNLQRDKTDADHKMLGTYHSMNSSVSDEDEIVQDMIAKKTEEDKDKVMLKVKANTWVVVPRNLATPEYAAKLRRKWDKK